MSTMSTISEDTHVPDVFAAWPCPGLSGFVRVCPVFVHLFPLFFRLFGQMDKVDKLLRVFSEGLADRSVNLSHPYSLIDKSYIDI